MAAPCTDQSRDKAWGVMFGLIMGDALGVPFEFMTAAEIPEEELIDVVLPMGFHKTYSNIPVGTWSDDSACALCLLESLQECGRMATGEMDLRDYGTRLLKWVREGYFAVGGEVFDVGNQTSASLQAFYSGASPEEAGLTLPNGLGDGGLMRAISVPVWHRGSDEALVRLAEDQVKITHGHPLNQVCSALYCLLARRLMDLSDYPSAYESACATLRSLYASRPDHLAILEEQLLDGAPPKKLGGAYVVDSLKSSLKAVAETTSYAAAVRRAIKFGNDTDTTAAIAGGLAGALYGYNAIPSGWLAKLRERETPERLMAKTAA